MADVQRLLAAGADKVGINTAAIRRPELLKEVAETFGNQVITLSVDARRAPGLQTASGYEVTTHGGKQGTGIDALAWAEKAVALGAGEILLNSMDGDGTTAGFDLEMIEAMRQVVGVPIIASGGAGKAEDFVAAVQAGADAVLAASVFHFGTLSIKEVKQALAAAGSPASRKLRKFTPFTTRPFATSRQGITLTATPIIFSFLNFSRYFR